MSKKTTITRKAKLRRRFILTHYMFTLLITALLLLSGCDAFKCRPDGELTKRGGGGWFAGFVCKGEF